MRRKRNRSESNYRRAKINSWCKLLEKDFDWDYGFLLEIERKKLSEMYSYFKTCTSTNEMPIVERDLHICLKLLDIILEKDDLKLKFSDIEFKPKDKETYEMKERLRILSYRKLYINVRNAGRFCKFEFPNEDQDLEIIYREKLRKAKAWELYHKIRCYRMFSWWD